MNDKPLPDFKCPVCPEEYELKPLYIFRCDTCQVTSCSIPCLKSHRKTCFLSDYPRKYAPRVMKLW